MSDNIQLAINNRFINITFSNVNTSRILNLKINRLSNNIFYLIRKFLKSNICKIRLFFRNTLTKRDEEILLSNIEYLYALKNYQLFFLKNDEDRLNRYQLFYEIRKIK